MPHMGNQGCVCTVLYSVKSYRVRGLLDTYQKVCPIRNMFVSEFYQQEFSGAGKIILDV